MNILTVIALVSILIISSTYGRNTNRAFKYPEFKVKFEDAAFGNDRKYQKSSSFPRSHANFNYKLLDNLILPTSSSADKIDKLFNMDQIHMQNEEDSVTTDNILQFDETFEMTRDENEQQHEIPELIANYDKRTMNSNVGCDCKIKNDVIDLGYSHYPRYLLNAVCQNERELKKGQRKCWRGSQCKPMEYKVRVLTIRSMADDDIGKDAMNTLLPEMLQPYWKFKSITVAAGCICTFG